MTLQRISAIALATLAFSACTDEVTKIVNRPFNPPIDQINGFLGYFDIATKQTSCGNCHVSHQRDWVSTKHASAWAGLLSAGAPQAFCTGCHSVSENGNALEGAVGYNLTPDSSYHDVQCESCHGAGFTHATEPDVGVKPLARVAAIEADTAGTCGECHSDTHHPFVEEWAQSRHAEANADVITAYAGNPTNYATCLGCHEGRNVLKKWGSTADYAARTDPINATTALGITCAVCHNPHGSPNSKQLRYPIDTPDPASNLCMQCHMRRTVPSGGSSRGNQPHAPQGAVLLGEAGYVNPAYVDTVLLNASATATHFSSVANPRLCAGCHLYSFPVSLGGDTVATGHLFRPIPCYDGNGQPTDTILNCAFNKTARSFKACAKSGCHATEDQVALVYSVERTRLQDLTAELWVDLDGDRTIDAYPVDTGMLAKIKANTTDLNPSNSVITAADGAEFNVRTFGEDALGQFMYANGDKSRGAHNPFYEEALLRASIDELTDLYSGQVWFPLVSPAVQQILSEPLGGSRGVPFPRPKTRQ